MLKELDEKLLKKTPLWRALPAWIIIFALFWITVGMIFKISARLFFIGWDLV